MTQEEIRMHCLKLAVELGGPPAQIVENAAKFLAFIRGVTSLDPQS